MGCRCGRASSRWSPTSPSRTTCATWCVKLVEPEEIKFFPGQYMDFMVPGTDESRSFSMANTPSRDGRFEFVIKIYPGGLFSEHLAEKVQVGDRLEVEAPFGTFTLRESRTSDLIFVGGGAGMAPVLGLLRSMADRGVERKATFYYGARRRKRDLCFEAGARSARREASPASATSRRSPSRSTARNGTARRA